MSKTNELLKDIKENLSQKSSSQKDEVRVMQSMLNDKEYTVGIYGKEGKEGDYTPAEEYRKMISNVISSTTKITKEEAAQLADKYEATKSDANVMVGISKEFINTYLLTGRKLPLGGREKSDCKLIIKENKDAQKKYPRKVSTDPETGKNVCESTPVQIKAHNSIKVFGSCPSWIKEGK